MMASNENLVVATGEHQATERGETDPSSDNPADVEKGDMGADPLISESPEGTGAGEDQAGKGGATGEDPLASEAVPEKLADDVIMPPLWKRVLFTIIPALEKSECHLNNKGIFQ